VALDANTSDTYAIWCGNATDTSAPFRVKRNGSVYLNSLMVLDKKDGNNWGLGGTDSDHEGIYTVTEGTDDEKGTYGYKAIDFSKLNFKQAVSITPVWGGGDTLGVKVSLWGVVNKTRNFNITFDPDFSSITGASEGGSYYTLDLNYNIKIDGNYFIIDHTNVVVDADYVYKEGYDKAASLVKYEPGARKMTVPTEYRSGPRTDTEYSLEETYKAGWDACFNTFDFSAPVADGTHLGSGDSATVTVSLTNYNGNVGTVSRTYYGSETSVNVSGWGGNWLDDNYITVWVTVNGRRYNHTFDGR